NYGENRKQSRSRQSRTQLAPAAAEKAPLTGGFRSTRSSCCETNLSAGQRDPQIAQLCFGLLGPASVGARARGAGVKYAGDLQVLARQGALRRFFRKRANADRPAGLKQIDHVRQRGVAQFEQRGLLRRWEFVRRKVPTRRFHEAQGAVVDHEEALEEALRGAETLFGPTPQTRA